MTAAGQDPGMGQVETTRAQAVSFRPEYRGYARVEPVSLVTVKSGLDGIIGDLSARPGQRFSAGDPIAHLGGPDRVKAQANAQAELSAALQTLAEDADAERAVRDTYGLKLADRAELDRARAELATAKARVAVAKDRLADLDALASILSPVSGRVVSLSAANGNRVGQDSPILVLQPDRDLWLRAVFYDLPTQLLAADRPASFIPADGTRGLPVRFAQRLPTLRADGGLTAFFEPAAETPRWNGGETGEAVVEGEPQEAVEVPTSALILDRGRWWVLVRTAEGLHRQAVEPGPSRGDRTPILQGLAAGDAVVVRDAYLLFHRAFGQRYTPPD
jgi:RND family efflux transporter MFP subunit